MPGFDRIDELLISGEQKVLIQLVPRQIVLDFTGIIGNTFHRQRKLSGV